MNGDVVILRHGPGRGRLPDYLHNVLDWLRDNRPETYGRLRLAYTGEPTPDLDGVATVVCWLGDPLRELYPACYDDAMRLAARARERSIPVVNPPEALSNTIKSRQAALWREAGLPTPRHVRFEVLDDLRGAAEGFDYPLIVRSDNYHSQQMWVCESERDLRRLRLRPGHLPGAVTEFVDTRWPVGAGPRVWSERYHRKRIFVLGGVCRTNHVWFSTSPIVSDKTSILKRRVEPPWWQRARRTKPKPKYDVVDRSWWAEEIRRHPARREGLELWEQAIEIDVDYWSRVAEHEALMVRATEVLGLGFAVIDYSSHADGSVVLWEANPYFHMPTHRFLLPELRRSHERVASFFELHAAFLDRCSSISS